MDTAEPRPEAEIIGNMTSDMQSDRLEGNEKKMTEDRDNGDRDSTNNDKRKN